MALASTIETNSGAITPTGIIVGLAPGSDPNAPVELWRAADSAGAPDTANAVMVFSGVVPPSGISFFDQLPSTAATYWYRSRINGAAYGPGLYNDWVNMGAPDRVAPDALTALLSGDTTQRSVAWDQLNARIGSHSQQMLPNFGFEDGLAFFVRSAGTDVSVITDNTKAHSGNKYLQVTSSTGVEANGAACDAVGVIRYFEVAPGDVVQWGGWIYRESGTANCMIELDTADKDKATLTAYFTPNQNTAAWVFVQGQLIVPAGAKYVRFYCRADSTGTGTVARFDDVFLRIAFGSSTIHNVQGSIPPTAVPGAAGTFFTHAWGGVAANMWVSWGWTTQTLYRADQSSVVVPGPPAAPAAPTLGQVAGGALGARTRWVRICYVKSARLYPVSAESSFAINANNLLVVTAPADPGGNLYDGWVVMVGTSSNGEIVQTVGLTRTFGVDWIEPVGGFDTARTPYSTNWKSITQTSVPSSVTVYDYGYYDPILNIVRITGGGVSPDAQKAAIQNGDGVVPLSFGSMTVSVGAGGTSGSGIGGGGKYL